jgi:hypothetical protein
MAGLALGRRARACSRRRCLGARRSVPSPWLACGRSFPLPSDRPPLSGPDGRRRCIGWLGGSWIGEVAIVEDKLGGDFAITYDHFFSAALTRLHAERRYRVFADLERIAGRFDGNFSVAAEHGVDRFQLGDIANRR